MKKNTMRVAGAAMALCLGLVLVSCGGRTRLTETWTDPNFKSGPVSKILVIGVTENERVRRVFEKKFVKALRAAGAEAHSSYAVLHIAGELKKADVLADPERFIVLDEDIVASLLDQRHAGKRLMLITNSEWSFANEIMTYTFDRYLPEGSTWRDLFGTVIVSASKPEFFTSSNPLYKVVDE